MTSAGRGGVAEHHTVHFREGNGKSQQVRTETENARWTSPISSHPHIVEIILRCLAVCLSHALCMFFFPLQH